MAIKYNKAGFKVIEEVLGPLRQVQLGQPGVVKPSSAPDTWVLLKFSIMTQPQESSWCWAAAAASIIGYYKGIGTLCQCKVVEEVKKLGKKKCCDGVKGPACEGLSFKIPSGCDVDGELDLALDFFNHLEKPAYTGKPDIQRLIDEIDRTPGRIVGIRESVGHFVVVDGYFKNAPIVHLQDPINGKAVEAIYDQWTVTHAYFTK